MYTKLVIVHLPEGKDGSTVKCDKARFVEYQDNKAFFRNPVRLSWGMEDVKLTIGTTEHDIHIPIEGILGRVAKWDTIREETSCPFYLITSQLVKVDSKYVKLMGDEEDTKISFVRFVD